MRLPTLLILPLLFVTGGAAAQTITIRDLILLYPPSGSCSLIAFRTQATSVFLSSSAINLRQWRGRSVELTGTMRTVQGCPAHLDVSTIKAVPQLLAPTARLPAGFQLELLGEPNRIYVVALGALENVANTIRIPGIDGPLHLRASSLAVVGTFVTQQSAPFATFTAASVPIGVKFYFQAASIGGPTAEMTAAAIAWF